MRVRALATLVATLLGVGCFSRHGFNQITSGGFQPTGGDSSSGGDTTASGDPGDGDGGGTCSGMPAQSASPPPQSGGTTYYVSSSAGSDANPGTLALPFATIQWAADLVSPGDTVIVEDGTYTKPASGALVFLGRGGSTGNWIWLKARNRGRTTLDGLNNTNDAGFAFGTGVGFVRIEGFEIFSVGNPNNSGTGIECWLGGHDVQIVGNHIHDIGKACTDVSNGESAIHTIQPNVTIENNLIHDIGRFAPGESSCTGLTTTHYQDSDPAIWLDAGADGAVVRNNVVYNIKRGRAIQLYGGTLSGVNIVNNTIAFANPFVDGHVDLNLDLSDSNIDNNIFYQPTNTVFNICCSPIVSNTFVTNNLTTATAMTSGAPPQGMTVANNILGADPLFVNAAGFDFHLQPLSPAIDVGASLSGVPQDFNGCPRPQGAGYDLGAYEY